MDWLSLLSFITLICTIVTVIIAIQKFKYEKNRDYYLRRLNEVYAPLYSLIIRQEAYRKIFSTFNSAIRNFPLLSAESVDGDVYFSFQDFEKTLGGINKGLARTNLLIQMNKLKMLKELEGFYARSGKTETESGKKARAKIVEEIKVVSKNLVEEIVQGYNQCVRKLKLEP